VDPKAWVKKRYRTVDKALSGVLPGGVPATFKPSVRGAYTRIDTGFGGFLPGGSPPVTQQYTKPGEKAAGVIGGSGLVDLKRNIGPASGWIGQAYHYFEKKAGSIIPGGGSSEPVPPGGVHVMPTAYIPIDVDDFRMSQNSAGGQSGGMGGGTPVGIGPSVIEQEMPRGGLRQIAVEMSTGWNQLNPAPSGVETRDAFGSNVDRYGDLPFGALPPEEKESAWDSFRRKYGFGVGMSAGFAASAVVGRIAGPVAGAAAFTSAQIAVDAILGEPTERPQVEGGPYIGYQPGVNSGFDYGKWGNNVNGGSRMWGSVGAARPMGGFGAGGAGRVRQADVLRQFGRRLTNAEFRSAYGYSPRPRRATRGYGRRTYGPRAYGRSFRRSGGTSNSLAYMKGMLAGMRRGYR
jgi:hypothetical protein